MTSSSFQKSVVKFLLFRTAFSNVAAFTPPLARISKPHALQASVEVSIESEDADSLPPQQEPADLPVSLLKLPRHATNEGVNEVLEDTERQMQIMHEEAQKAAEFQDEPQAQDFSDQIFANTYVDLGKVSIVGFDYDYTLVTYTNDLLHLIYDMALTRLVEGRQYPIEMLATDESGNRNLGFDPFFSIRGLAVDKEMGWICHLSYTHKVATAWEGREKLPSSRIYEEYRGKRALTPKERKNRLKPLNDLFSMAECCLIADTIQFFKDNNIDFCPTNTVTDVLGAIRDTHISGDFHRIVADDPQKYFDPTPHLQPVLRKLKKSGKRLIFVSNSPYWYVDAGMKYVLGDDWMRLWDAVIVSAGKPAFYTETRRPFREVNRLNSRVNFKRVDKFVKGEVYTEGCLRELTRLMDWNSIDSDSTDADTETETDNDVVTPGALSLSSASVLYIGDSLFADLVDAKREYGWVTAAVTPEVGAEMEIQTRSEFMLVEQTIDLLLHALRSIQANQLGPANHSDDDRVVLDALERLVSQWRDQETQLLGNPFGSVFRARYQPSLFAHSLRRYCDLYMSKVGSLVNYSPQHRFYPESGFRLLSHEIRSANDEVCWDLSDAEEK